MTVYVDADACPVKAEIEKVATRHGTPVIMVANGGLRPSLNPLVETIFVSQGADVADMWIAERAGVGDIVITSDIPLAARSVEGGALVLRPDGRELNATNIGDVLATRDLMSDLRAADPFRQSSGRAFSKADRSRFLDALETAMRKAKT